MIWYHIKERCYDQDHERYKSYGAIGVRLCDEWLEFPQFLKDIPNVQGYDEEKLLNGEIHLDKDILDRGNKVYSPQTCAFVLKSENNMHKPNQMRKFQAISSDGTIFEGYNQSEFAREHGLRQSNISNCLYGTKRHHKGWTFKFME